MIPVKPQPEPDDFDEKVRQPGLAFLSQVPNPKTEDWKNYDYWRRSLPDLYTSYNKICATSVESCNKTLQSLRFTQVKSIVYWE